MDAELVSLTVAILSHPSRLLFMYGGLILLK